MSYPKSVQAGIPRLKELQNGYSRVKFGDILYEEKRPIKLIDSENYRLITIKRSRGGVEERGFLRGKKILVKSQFQIQENDFVISKRQIVHGACALIDKNFDGSIVSNEYSVLKVKSNLNKHYLKYLSYTRYFQQTCFHSSIGVHIEKMIFKLPDWLKWEVNIPSLEEQEKIASFLTSVDTKIEQLTKKESLLQEYKKGVMQKIFNQEIRFKDDDGSEFCDWEEKKLGELCKIAKSGGTPTSTNKSFYDGDIPFLAISNITKQGKYLTYTSKKVAQKGLDNSASWIVPANTIIYSMYASVGFVSINKIPLATSQAVINLILKDNVNTEYIYYYLLDYKKYIHKYIETGTQGNLNAQSVKSLKVKFPSFDEQTKIANFLSSIDTKIEKIQKQLEQTKEFKKALLQQMFV